MKKKFAMLALAGLMAATALTGCGKLKDSDVAVTVDGDKVTADIANFFARYTQAQYETYYSGYMGDDMWSGEAEEGKTYEETVKDTIRESLESMYILEDHMKDYDIELTDEEKKSIKDTAADFDEANGLEEKEKISGTKSTVEKVLTLMTIQTKMQKAIEDTADMEVSDDEAAQKKMQYVIFSFSKTDDDGNSVDLTDDEKAELKKQAEAFAEGAKTASDFAAYAKEQGQEAKDATFDASSTTIPSQLAEAADKLGEGETTDMVEGDNGYYVAKVTSLFDREATDAQKQTIISQRKQDKYNDTIEKWRKDTKIEVNKKVWKKIDFNKLSVTMKIDESDPYTDNPQTDDQAEESN